MIVANEVLIAIVTSTGAMLTSIMNLLITNANSKSVAQVKKQVESSHTAVSQVQEQVKNTHDTNLRHDIDAIIKTTQSTHERIHSLAEEMGHQNMCHDREHERMWRIINRKRN